MKVSKQDHTGTRCVRLTAAGIASLWETPTPDERHSHSEHPGNMGIPCQGLYTILHWLPVPPIDTFLPPSLPPTSPFLLETGWRGGGGEKGFHRTWTESRVSDRTCVYTCALSPQAPSFVPRDSCGGKRLEGRLTSLHSWVKAQNPKHGSQAGGSGFGSTADQSGNPPSASPSSACTSLPRDPTGAALLSMAWRPRRPRRPTARKVARIVILGMRGWYCVGGGGGGGGGRAWLMDG